jgi:hypothetical protein
MRLQFKQATSSNPTEHCRIMLSGITALLLAFFTDFKLVNARAQQRRKQFGR